jgi:hypothetical protein
LGDVCFASKKSSEREFFVPAGTHLGVKLLTTPFIAGDNAIGIGDLIHNKIILLLFPQINNEDMDSSCVEQVSTVL